MFTRELFQPVGRDQRLGGLIYLLEFHGNLLYVHFPTYHIVLNQGIATTSLFDFKHGTIRTNKEGPPLPANLPWVTVSGGGTTVRAAHWNTFSCGAESRRRIFLIS